MAKSFWKRLFDKISNKYAFYFWLQLISNTALNCVSLLLLLSIGTFEVKDASGAVVTSGKDYDEITKGNHFTEFMIVGITVCQFYLGLVSILKVNPFDLFGYCSINSLTNFQLIALFYFATNPFQMAEGMRYSKDSELLFQISFPKVIGIPLCIIFLVVTVVTILIMFPIYKEMAWKIYEVVGLEETLQRAFRNIQFAKASFLIYFCLTILQFANLVYFEVNFVRLVAYYVTGIFMLVSIRLGYLALKREKTNYLNSFLLWALVFMIGTCIIIGLRQFSIIDHHRSGPLNKVINLIVTIISTINLLLMIKYCLLAENEFGRGVTRLQKLLQKGKESDSLDEKLQEPQERI